MDMSFKVEKLLDHALIKKDVQPASEGAKGEKAVEISAVHDGKLLMREWVLEQHPNELKTDYGTFVIGIARKTKKMPFTLTLKDFRKVDYPGTNQPSSYESDVALVGHRENITIGKTISMNKPLDYDGYRIFQSSYVQDPTDGEASIFTVAKNPGITLIYSGACVLFLGVFLTFFVPPLSSFKS